MKPKISECYSIYPGEFVPADNQEKIYKAPKVPAKNCGDSEYFTVKESRCLYEVQLSAPGLKREKFIVYGNDQSLSINAPPNRQIKRNKKLNCYIPMPENADTELAIAEYKNGVLYLYIPKTKHPGKHINTRIVVY